MGLQAPMTLGNSNLPTLNVMSKAARRASRRLMRDFGEIEHLLSSIKGTSDFAERSWTAAENSLVTSLSEARPNYGMRSMTLDRRGEDPTRRWILDELNGKFNFRRGIAHWAISVALEHKGEVVAAVILDPLRNEEFHSIKGTGSRINEMRLRCSNCSLIGDMLMASDRSFVEIDEGAGFDQFSQVFGKIGGVRVSGSLSLDMAYLAAGRFDGFLGNSCAFPSFAAASLIAREAGVLVERLDQSDSEDSPFAAVAGCGRIFEDFSKLVKQPQKS